MDTQGCICVIVLLSIYVAWMAILMVIFVPALALDYEGSDLTVLIVVYAIIFGYYTGLLVAHIKALCVFKQDE